MSDDPCSRRSRFFSFKSPRVRIAFSSRRGGNRDDGRKIDRLASTLSSPLYLSRSSACRSLVLSYQSLYPEIERRFEINKQPRHSLPSTTRARKAYTSGSRSAYLRNDVEPCLIAKESRLRERDSKRTVNAFTTSTMKWRCRASTPPCECFSLK